MGPSSPRDFFFFGAPPGRLAARRPRVATAASEQAAWITSVSAIADKSVVKNVVRHAFPSRPARTRTAPSDLEAPLAALSRPVPAAAA